MESKVAIVLSGGGAKGAYEAGALGPIADGLGQVDIVTGSSIGAINAAVFAATYDETGDIREAVQRVKDSWYELDSIFHLDVWYAIRQALFAAFRTRSISLQGLLSFRSVVNNRAIVKKVYELIPDKKISEIQSIDLAITATDLTRGRTISFTRANDISLREAVLASSSLPMILPSREIGSSFYVDGGVFDNTPLRDAITLGASEIFIVELKPKDKETYFETISKCEPIDSVYEVGSRLMELILDRVMYEDLKKAKRVNEIVKVIQELESRREYVAAKKLKEAIGFNKKWGKPKRIVEFHEIAPSIRLEPPGTLGFDDKAALDTIMRLGEKDARAVLRSRDKGSPGTVVKRRA